MPGPLKDRPRLTHVRGKTYGTERRNFLANDTLFDDCCRDRTRIGVNYHLWSFGIFPRKGFA